MKKFKFGYMTRGQFTPEQNVQEVFEEICGHVRLADKYGFDCFVKGSHYSSHPFQELQQIPMLCRLMAEGPNLRFGMGICLLALHKPLDIAEQVATMDVMTGGKMIFGAALGYRDVEYKAFGVKKGTGRVRFEENLEAVKRLWTEDKVDMKGTHFELADASVSVKPVQKPHPPIWIGANADIAIERAARMGDCWYISSHHRMDTLQRQIEVYKRALDKAGKPFPDELPFRRELFVADNRKQAIEYVRPYLGKKYEAYHAWGQDKVMPEGDNDLGQGFDDLLDDRFLLGSPDEVAEGIIDSYRKLGTNLMVITLQYPGMPSSMTTEAMHRFAEEVMPKVEQGI